MYLKSKIISQIYNIVSKYIPENSPRRNVIILMSANAFSQLSLVVASLALTRLYRPLEFGIFALFFSITALLTILATGQYEHSINLPKKEEDAVHIASVSLLLTIIVTFIIITISFLAGNTLLLMLNIVHLKVFLYLVPLSVFVAAVYQLSYYLSLRKKMFHELALSSILMSLATITGQVLLAYAPHRAYGLVLGYIIANYISTIYLIVKVFGEYKHTFFTLSCRSMLEQGKRYKNFFSAVVPSSLTAL
jgi:O-antigen/teichoic acid export membrane protein